LKHILTIALTTILATTILACGAKHKNILETGQSQVNLRSMQSRVFDTTDRERLLKTIIATLQDLAFLIDDADMDLGTVSGTRTSEYFMRITVSVRPRGDHQNIVRANAQHNLEIVEDPEPYQAFFSALSKSLFLEAHLVDDESAAGGSASSSKTMAPAPKKTTPPKTAAKSAATPEPTPAAKTIAPTPKAPEVASVPPKEPVVRVSLRKQPAYISNQMQISDMLLEYDFFDSSRNPQGAFVNSFVDNNDGTVTDKATGLMWQKSGSSLLSNRRAREYITQLNRKRFAGHSDWRMPTVEELASLLAADRKNGAHIDPAFDYKQTRCWTIDRCESQSWSFYKGAWLVDFKNGAVNEAYWSREAGGMTRKNAENYTKAVRTVR
jgi:hypothetical protein